MIRRIKLPGILFGASFLALSITGATAATVSISGGLPALAFPGYGAAIPLNNVVNNSAVTDPGLPGALYLGTTANGPAVVSYAGVGQYQVDWYYLGAESGFTNTLTAPGVHFAENDTIPAVPTFLGSSLNQTSTILNFSVSAVGGTPVSVANGPLNAAAGLGIANFVFAYLVQTGPAAWLLTSTPGDWFLLGWNDNGGPDDDHDDLMAIAHVTAVPVPAALPLFAGGLGVMAWMARRRKRTTATEA